MPGQKLKYTFKCESCGKEFLAWNKKQKFCCKECAKTNESLKWKAKEYQHGKTQTEKNRARKKREKALLDIATEAREAGMTYGQYVAKYGL